MLLVCKLGERPSYVACFPDGTRISLPPGVHATVELMSRFTGLTGKRLKDIRTVDELASALQAFYDDLTRMYAQAADALPWALRRLSGQQLEEPGSSPA